MIRFIKYVRDNFKPLGVGILVGGGLSNEFTLDILTAVIKLVL